MRLLAAALLLAAGIGAPDVPRLVTVDVTVTDARGRALTDLKPSDFELREGGALLPLESVRLVRVAAGPAAEPAARIQSAADEKLAAGQDQARLFAIFLDEYHVASGAETDRVRDTLTRFVDRDVSSRDLIVVMKPLDSLFAIRLTRDRDAVRRSIESFEGRKGDYQPRNAYERDYIAGTPARIDVARAQVALSAINALAVHLGSLADRRKTLIVATDSVGRSDRRRGQEYLPTLDTIIRSANRSNVSVYPFDPGGEPAGEDLRRLADETARLPPTRSPACAGSPPTRAPTTCSRSAPRIPTMASFGSCRRGSIVPAPWCARAKGTGPRHRTKRCGPR
jgi:VWFA-related protein